MIRFLMAAGYALTRIGRLMQGKTREQTVVVFIDPSDQTGKTGFLENDMPALRAMLGRKMPPREELN